MQTTILDSPRLTAGWRLLSHTTSPAYIIRFACTKADVAEAQALRFEVFNLELAEGLVTSFLSGRDADPFDDVCQHLLVQETSTGKVVGTYRLQTGLTAAANLGYYSEAEFDLDPFANRRAQIIELGRACVHKDHRNRRVLAALWRGIADYARQHGARYLMGCSSLHTTDPALGLALYRQLAAQYLAPLEWRTLPRPTAVCPAIAPLPLPPKVPRLLGAYLSLGAWIAGPPAMDREFGTVDFLTILDLEQLHPEAAWFWLGRE